MSGHIVVSHRQFIAVSHTSMLVYPEKGTFHCLAYKEKSKKRDGDEGNYSLSKCEIGNGECTRQKGECYKVTDEKREAVEYEGGDEGKSWTDEEQATFASRKKCNAK